MTKINQNDVKELKEDEYLLKINHDFGFLTKLNKDDSIPKAFTGWGNSTDDVYIFTESFNSGWKIKSYRTGKSQNWVVLTHPAGFNLEIYMKSFFSLIKNNDIINGELIGEFKWSEKTLIKKII